MKRCTFHIGSGKCGSTAAQSVLASHRKWLKNNGVELFVPSDLSEINAINMATYVDHVQPSEVYVRTSRRVVPILDEDARIAWLRQHFSTTAADHILVSNEYFADIHPRRHAARLSILERVLPPCDDLTLLYYVRRPDDLFVSLYLQWFLPHLPVSMSEFYREFDFGGGGVDALSLNWYQHARAITERFPSAKVVVRPYEEAASVGIARDFAEAAGLGSLPRGAKETQANVSLRGVGYQLHKRFGRSLPRPLRRRFYRALLRINPRTRYDRSLLMSPRLRSTILEHYRSDNVRLFKEFGIGDAADLDRLWYS